MLMTVHLSETETLAYATLRAAIRSDALRRARKGGQRFVQIVGVDGRIRDVLEAS
jgi:hypothetical protein